MILHLTKRIRRFTLLFQNRFIWIRVLALYVFAALFSPTTAQIPNKALAFNALTINDGLSQGMVTCIFQDRYGFMWFATLDGLNRYDGYHFVIYHHDEKNRSSISEGLVQTLFEDSKGRLWMGTSTGGLDIVDRKSETFVHVSNQQEPSPFSSVTAIAEDRLGNIWVQSANGLRKIVVDESSKLPATAFSIRPVHLPFHSADAVLHSTKKRDLYYANSQTGLIYQLDDAVKERWTVAFTLNNDFFRTGSKNRGTSLIVELLEDPGTEKMYVLQENSIICLNEKTGTIEKVHPNVHIDNHSTSVRAVIDRNGVIGLCKKDGFYFFDTRTEQLTKATTSDPDIARALQHTYCTFIDRSGLLWIGTAGYGILKRNALSEAFHHSTTLYTYSLKERIDGKVIVGNSLSTRAVFDKEKAEMINEERQNGDTKPSLNLQELPIAINQWGYWFVDVQGLRLVDKASNKTTNYPLPIQQSIVFDAAGQCSLSDLAGNIWLGTTEGLLRFSLTEKKWTVYHSDANDPASLTSNLIFSLCLDPAEPRKYLWVGTGGSGLNRMDMTTGKCRFYSTINGLPNNVIYSILDDDEGNLWMSTNKGLSCFNPQRQTFRNFDYKDGLQSNEFNRGAYLRTKDGCFFFGGVNGFNYFYPHAILKNTIAPQVNITGIKIRNQPLTGQSQNVSLTAAIYLTKTLTLPFTENIVSFEFASMDFTNPEKNQYQYKLNGFDKEWVHAGTVNTATYTNLDPGTYTFAVKGSNSDGTWNNTGASLRLIILPPWYMTWWFRTVAVLVICLVAYTFYRYRLKHALKLHAIRNRIASDLHDEVGSNLSNVFIFSNVAQQKATAGHETTALLEKITDYTQQSMEAMNDIVWMINTRNDQFENIMVRMRSLAAECAETSGFSLHLNLDEKLNHVKLNMEERKNFYLIYKEAINNVVKYAACKNLWIRMKLEQHTVVLEIKDDGKGFVMTNPIKGNGIINMKKRTEMLKGKLNINSCVSEGTMLVLRFNV